MTEGLLLCSNWLWQFSSKAGACHLLAEVGRVGGEMKEENWYSLTSGHDTSPALLRYDSLRGGCAPAAGTR